MKKIIKAPAKINLCLRVNKKREDGYHDLTMIMQAISLFDTIECDIIKNNKFNNGLREQIVLKCNYNYVPTDSKNLIYKVVKYIYDRYGINDKISIVLKKLIPTGGGLGGGSSDAASMLLFLNRFYKLNLSLTELSEIAAMFGSDIPFFIYKKECICEGRGEIVHELRPFSNYYILLATPNVRVSTKEVFTKFDSFDIPEFKRRLESNAFNNCVDAIKRKDLKLLSSNLFNDLEIVTESMLPDVTIFKDKMIKMGALTSLMSGSGPTVFGIFNSYFKAIKCKDQIKKENNNSFVFLARPI